MATEIHVLLATLADAPDGLTRPELLARLREQFPYLGPNDVELVLQAAATAVRIDANRIYPARRADGEEAEHPGR